MNFINIGGSSSDPFYRYRMPALSIVQKKGKTEIINLEQVAKELDRPVKMIVAWFKKRLSISASQKDGKVILSGSFDKEILQKELTRFIEATVLCSHCGNPETTVDINGNMDCKSCGIESKIKVDCVILRCI